MIRAAKLDVDLYEEVEADQGALGQAMVVVALSSVAAGIGRFGQGGVGGMLIAMVVAIVGWYIWAYLTYFIGTITTSRSTNQSRSRRVIAHDWFFKFPRVNSSIWNHPGADRDRFSCGFDLDVDSYGDCGEASA